MHIFNPGKFRHLSVTKPFIYSFLIFAALSVVPFFIAEEEYKNAQNKEHETLQSGLSVARSKFMNVLYNNVAAANALAIIYKDFGLTNNYDRIAEQILEKTKYAEAIQITQNGIIKKIYPLKGYENTIGINTWKDSLRRKEELKAYSKNEIYFVGPRILRQGGIGILGKAPVEIDSNTQGLVVVLTKFSTIQKVYDLGNGLESKFAVILKKKSDIENINVQLSKCKPNKKSEVLTTTIPYGDWRLEVSYHEKYRFAAFPFAVLVFGLLVSALASYVTFRILNHPYELKRIINIKTHEVNERIKELTTIYKLNKLLQENYSTDELLNKIVNIIPSGWQYPEICAARITFEGKEYRTENFMQADSPQKATFKPTNVNEGVIEVVYTQGMKPEQEGPFLEEERNLINSMAEILEIYFNKIHNQSALVRSETKFRSAFEHSSIGMAIVSLDGKWLTVNKGLCEMLGYSEEELLNIDFQGITHHEDLYEDEQFIKDSLAGNADFFRTEKRYYHKNGSIVWVNLNVSVLRDTDGKPLHFISQIENITERKESQQKFKDLVEKSPVGVYIFKNKRFAYVNPRILLKSGYNEQEIMHLSLDEFIHPEDLKLVTDNISRRLNGEADHNSYEVRAYKKSGEIMWIELFGTATFYEGAPAIIGTMVNISEKKALHDERDKIVADLLQRNRDLEQFSYMVSHNIRGPLATILGLSNLLAEDDLESGRDEVLLGLKTQANKLDYVVKDVNTILNVRKNIHPVKTTVNFTELTLKVLEDLNESITISHAQVNYDFYNTGNIYSIEPYLQSIFLNLISNSIKYRMPEKAPQINIRSSKEANKLKLYFQDNGLGIDMEKYGEQIFGLYKRFNNSVEGKGLGLYMVKTQVDTLGGNIALQSEPGKGALFTITLPIS